MFRNDVGQGQARKQPAVPAALGLRIAPSDLGLHVRNGNGSEG